MVTEGRSQRHVRDNRNVARGAAYIDGRFMPIAEAMIPVTEWGYRRSDVTYDVVSVWDGMFFKLDDHLRRFRDSMDVSGCSHGKRRRHPRRAA